MIIRREINIELDYIILICVLSMSIKTNEHNMSYIEHNNSTVILTFQNNSIIYLNSDVAIELTIAT